MKILLLRQYITGNKIFLTVFLPRFSTLGSTGPVKRLKGGQIMREKSSSQFLDVNTRQGPKLRLPGRQCDEKFSPGDPNFIAGRQLATCKAGCYCGLKRSEKLIEN